MQVCMVTLSKGRKSGLKWGRYTLAKEGNLWTEMGGRGRCTLAKEGNLWTERGVGGATP